MRCTWKEIEPTDSSGHRRVECVRCGFTTKPTNSTVDYIFARCYGTPFWWEFGAWTEITLQVIGISTPRWLWLKAQLGLKPQCGCQKRVENLDSMGQRLKLALTVLGNGYLRTWLWLRDVAYRSAGSLYRHRRQQLLTHDHKASRSGDADGHLAPTANAQDFDADVTANKNPLTLFPRQNEHHTPP